MVLIVVVITFMISLLLSYLAHFSCRHSSTTQSHLNYPGKLCDFSRSLSLCRLIQVDFGEIFIPLMHKLDEKLHGRKT